MTNEDPELLLLFSNFIRTIYTQFFESPPCADVPPNRLIKASVGRSSSNSNRGSLPELSEKDILEGLSLFDTHGCFESLPSNWESEETPLTSQAKHYNQFEKDVSLPLCFCYAL